MRVHDTDIPGVRLIEAEPASDARGSFTRLYCPEELAAAGVDFTPVQVNLSRNPARHTLRGMHFQEPPRAEAKLVHVTRGAAFDVAVDLRPDSPTYRRWTGAQRVERVRTGSRTFLGLGHEHGHRHPRQKGSERHGYLQRVSALWVQHGQGGVRR